MANRCSAAPADAVSVHRPSARSMRLSDALVPRKVMCDASVNHQEP